jgi:hypothetical protein
MRSSILISTAALLAAHLCAQAPAQTTAQNATKTTAAAAKKVWTPARTPDGQPDLQGVWTNPTITPFERPANLGTKAYLTEQEAAELEKQAAATNVDAPPRPGDVGAYNRVWFDSGTKVVSTYQTSLVVDPPNGRVPIQKWAEDKRDYDLAHVSDSWEHMSVWDRCITRGVPAGMFPAGYNNAYQIVQIPGAVVILYEMIHETRIIPIDGRPHLDANIRQWNGDSRGHWEGSTLVVETTNYNNKGWIATSAATGRVKGTPISEDLRVVERFTRTAPDTILYEVTITDPKVYTQPWKVSIPLSHEDNYVLYEYACHEGNHAVENILGGGRVAEQGH